MAPKRKTALLCVLNVDEAEVFKDRLENLGFEVTVERNFDKALNLALKKKFDVAIAGDTSFQSGYLGGRDVTPVALLNRLEKTNPGMRLVAFMGYGGRFSDIGKGLKEKGVDVIIGVGWIETGANPLKEILSRKGKKVDWKSMLQPVKHITTSGLVSEQLLLELEDLKASGRLEKQILARARSFRQGYRPRTTASSVQALRDRLRTTSVRCFGQKATIEPNTVSLSEQPTISDTIDRRERTALNVLQRKQRQDRGFIRRSKPVRRKRRP